jgi:hypothetical protein
MLAHREARAIAFGTAGKLRVLTDLLAQHHPARTLIFTEDNPMVYRISRAFLLPAITHHTPVKERHTILHRFRRMVKIFELAFPREVTLLPSPVLWLVFRSTLTHTQRQCVNRDGKG